MDDPPLIIAAENNNLRSVRILLRSGVDVNEKADDGMTALTFAAMNGNLDIMEILLEEDGIDVNAANDEGTTPLMFAVSEGHYDAVNFLLDTPNIDVNLRDNEGNSALMDAVSTIAFIIT